MWEGLIGGWRDKKINFTYSNDMGKPTVACSYQWPSHDHGFHSYSWTGIGHNRRNQSDCAAFPCSHNCVVRPGAHQENVLREPLAQIGEILASYKHQRQVGVQFSICLKKGLCSFFNTAVTYES